jgi:hypothetical protein
LYPELFEGGGPAHFAGYGGFDWRPSGDERYRRTTGRVCQPAYALHSFWGCHFRCAYCNLGHVAHVYVNLEDWIEHIEEGLANLENSPGQRLFQWDNGTDIVCWEPEYGGAKMLIELFARQPDKYLELYVGKSDFVQFMLDYDHRGHTVCCWSLSHETQARDLEKRTASMEDRLRAARLCQEAGYPVRIRFSPMIPTVGWEKDIRHMIRRMFEEITPEVLTIEPLRFYNYQQLCADFEEGVLDPEFLNAMKALPAAAATMLQTLPVYARLLVWPAPLLYHYNGVLPYQDSFLAGPVLFAVFFVALCSCALNLFFGLLFHFGLNIHFFVIFNIIKKSAGTSDKV